MLSSALVAAWQHRDNALFRFVQLLSSQPFFQQEGTEVGERIDSVGKAYISGRELDTALDVGVLFTADQGRKGLGTIVSCLDLYGKELVCRADEEILLQLGILALIIIDSATRFSYSAPL